METQEIERKFLLVDNSWKNGLTGTPYKQAYLSSNPDRIVRIRVAGDKAFITIKGKPAPESISRPEYEYEIPLEDAEYMYENLCEPERIEKTRYLYEFKGHIWEIDEFHGENEGLIVAEIELKSEDETFEKPDWLGKDISFDYKYTNNNLAKKPYTSW